MGLAPFSFPGDGGSVDATQDFAPAQNRFSNPVLDTSPGFQLGHTPAPAPGAGSNAGYNPMLSLARRHSNVWKCHFVAFGNVAQQQYCRTVHLSLETLSQTILGDSGIINLLEKLLTLLQIQGCFGAVRKYRAR